VAFPEFHNFSVGVAIENIGTKVKFMKDAYSLPLTFRIGLKSDILNTEISTLGILCDIEKSNDERLKIPIGIRYIYNQIFTIRGGYIFGADLNSFTLGAGINFQITSFKLIFDYAFVPYSKMGSTHRISLLFSF